MKGIQLINLNGKPFLSIERKEYAAFKEWIENTSLFQAILKYSGRPNVIIETFTEAEMMSLELNTKKITKIEELPRELLFKFYENSPWYKQPDSETNKLINEDDNGDKIQEVD